MARAKTKATARAKAAEKAPGQKRKAAAAAREAKKRVDEADARGARLTAGKQALRDSLIVARRAQDWTWEMIAVEAGVSVRQAQKVFKDAKGLRSPLDDSPMKVLEDLATGFKLSIGDFEAMAFANAETNPSVALGAKRAADEARTRYMELQQRVGNLPRNLRVFRSEARLRSIATEMFDVLTELRAGKITADEAFEHFQEIAFGKPDERAEPKGLPSGNVNA